MEYTINLGTYSKRKKYRFRWQGILFWLCIAIVSFSFAYWLGYNDQKRSEDSELLMSQLCEAQGWVPELKGVCHDYS